VYCPFDKIIINNERMNKKKQVTLGARFPALNLKD
jgi:hypothetical protein